jgi:hypothetical protein
VIEQLLGAPYVHVVAPALLAPEVANEAHVDHGVRRLGPDHVLELLLAQVDPVDVDALWVSLPGNPVDPADLVIFEQAPGQQPALAACDAGDENLFHRFPKGLRDQGNSAAAWTLPRGGRTR